MFNNKYVACIECGVVFDTEEYSFLFENEDNYSICGCDVYFYKDSNGYACCGKIIEKEEK